MLASVLALDPGGTTGWKWALLDASMEPSFAVRHAFGIGEVRGGQITGGENEQVRAIERFWSSACQRADRFARGQGEQCQHHLVAEGFVLGLLNSDPSLLSPVRILSKLDLMANEGRFEGLDLWDYSQTAADAKSIITDERLRRWGLWVPGNNHENDACRHLILHLRRHGGF